MTEPRRRCSSVEGLTQTGAPLIAGFLFSVFGAASARIPVAGAPLLLGGAI